MTPTVVFDDLGTMDYKAAWDLQEARLDSIVKLKQIGQKPPSHLYFVEHPHVYTLGKHGEQKNLLI